MRDDFKERHRAILRQTLTSEAEVEKRLESIIAADSQSKLHWNALARLLGLHRGKK